nr:uncharacterized protein LOC127307228 isoform X1 [Lolium perenne]
MGLASPIPHLPQYVGAALDFGIVPTTASPVRRFRIPATHCAAARLAPSTPTFSRPRPPLSGAASGLVSRPAPPRGSPDGCAVEEATRRPGMASRPPTKRRTARPWRPTLGYVGGDVEQRAVVYHSGRIFPTSMLNRWLTTALRLQTVVCMMHWIHQCTL